MKRSTCKLFNLFLLLSISTLSFAQSFEWARRSGSYAYDYGRGICTDGSNNVYVTGEFEHTGYFNGITINSRGNHDIFVSKYNAYGAIQWVRRAGGTAGDVGHAISSDLNGNVYVSGEFQGSADFGHITLNGGYLNDIFIAKYDKWGNIQWAKKAGGAESDKGLGVSDKYGNVYVTGFFQGAATFGSSTIYSNGDKDIFLAKYNTYGALLWVRKFGSSKKDEGRSVAIDPSGNVIVGGFFQGTIAFGSVYLTCSGDHDGFITKFDANGNTIWARKVNGPYYEVTRGVTSDNYGNIYATGVFCYGARFENVQLNPYGQGDIFISSYTSSGALRWVKRAGGTLYDEGTGIKAEANGNVYLTGRFSGNAAFGATVLYGADGNEVFITSLTSWGAFRWAVKGGGSADQSYSYGENESGLAITIDGNRSVYTTGASRSGISFGSTYLNQYYNTDVFVSKVNQYNVSNRMEAFLDIKEKTEDAVLLSTDEFESFNYYWYRDGQLITDARSSQYRATEKGDYSIMVVHESDTAYSHKLSVDPALYNRLPSEASSNVDAYPNPAVDLITIPLEGSSSSLIHHVVIYNLTGQVVLNRQVMPESGKLVLQLTEDLPDGVYVMKSSSERGELYARFLIQRR